MSKGLVDRVIEQLGTLVLRAPDSKLLHAIETSADKVALAHELAIQLRMHRVLQIAQANARALSELHSFYALVGTEINALIARHGILRYLDVGRVIPLLPRDKVMLIKGAAVAPLYPMGMTRHMVDLDILTKDFEDLWEILERTRPSYSYSRLKLYVFPRLEVTGSLDLSTRISTEPLPNVDVHVKAFPIWGATKYEADLWLRRRQVGDLLAPSWEDCLLIVAAHVVKQWLYRLRDLNDVYVILHGQGSGLDWDYVVRTGRREGLLGVLQMLIRETGHLYGNTMSPLPEDLAKVGVITRYFARYNRGRTSRVGAFALQSRFLYGRYRRDFGMLQTLSQSLANGLNQLVYDNRAYRAPKKRVIRKIRPNEILVLVPTPSGHSAASLALDPNLGEPVGSPSLRVVHPGTQHEYFLTPEGAWVQSSYYGRL